MKKNIILFILLIVTMLNAEEKIGLALSGGGARGLAHIGVLKVIDEMGIKIDYISGTSTGAIVGGLYAMGYTGKEIEEIFLKIDWLDILNDKVSREDVYIGQKRWKPHSNFRFPLNDNFIPSLPQGFLPGNKLVNKFFELTYPVSAISDFDELPITFRCTATDVFTGELKVFSSGSLHEAIRASISFPSFLEPFEIDGKSYIDGGINANFPVEIAADMGADFIIGVKVTSGLRQKDNLNSLIDILDQTVNFKISENVEESQLNCNVVINPDLERFSNTSFNKKRDIIEQGVLAARKKLIDIELPLKGKDEIVKPENSIPVKFNKIAVEGNRYLSASKIKRFLELEKNVNYSPEEITRAFKYAYNSELFDCIYPKLVQQEDGLKLIIKVKERNRKKLGLNYTYNDNNEFVAGVILELNNYLQRNSKLLFNVQLGNITEIDLDYVKNFGRMLGIYFRIFPHYRETRLYSYNEDHEKINSVKSRQIGATGGVGFFSQYAVNAEVYAFTYHTKMYRDIAEFDDTRYRSSGIGFKVYHENLDDYIFPMKGTQILAKISKAEKDVYSDVSYNKFYSRLKLVLPFGKTFSFKYQFEYGSYFESDDIEFDPFLIGGLDSFIGLNSNEMSAPIYKINSLALRFEILKNLFADLHYNILTLGNSDIWLPETNVFHGIGLKLGYNSTLGPVRATAALDEDLNTYFYFSLGYEWDFFEFSRH
jgi:NTE family protein